jgi:hypothetical protein
MPWTNKNWNWTCFIYTAYVKYEEITFCSSRKRSLLLYKFVIRFQTAYMALHKLLFAYITRAATLGPYNLSNIFITYNIQYIWFRIHNIKKKTIYFCLVIFRSVAQKKPCKVSEEKNAYSILFWIVQNHSDLTTYMMMFI